MAKPPEGSHSNNTWYYGEQRNTLRFSGGFPPYNSNNYKRDERHDVNNNNNNQDIYHYTTSTPPTARQYNPAQHAQTSSTQQQQRGSLTSSSDSFLKVGTDRTSISKMLAKRRASAPNVSAPHARTHAQSALSQSYSARPTVY